MLFQLVAEGDHSILMIASVSMSPGLFLYSPSLK